MKPRLLLSSFALAILAAGCTTTPNLATDSTIEAKRSSLDAEAEAALQNLATQVPSSRELVRQAHGILVFPSLVSAGLVVGGSHGHGVLRVGGATRGYYNATGASVGLLAGADSKAVFVLFMTQDALDRFEASHGWTAGVDASVTVLKVGADGTVTTQTVQQPIVGFALSNAGLMANLSFEGMKFSRVDR
jgi:lipid-binding SYLF domain-containing protein